MCVVVAVIFVVYLIKEDCSKVLIGGLLSI